LPSGVLDHLQRHDAPEATREQLLRSAHCGLCGFDRVQRAAARHRATRRRHRDESVQLSGRVARAGAWSWRGSVMAGRGGERLLQHPPARTSCREKPGDGILHFLTTSRSVWPMRWRSTACSASRLRISTCITQRHGKYVSRRAARDAVFHLSASLI